MIYRSGGDQIFTAVPREREWQSWLAVGLLAGAIFLISLFAAPIRDYIIEEWGRDNFTYASAAAVLVFLVIALAWYVRYPHRTVSGSVVLLGTGALYGYLVFDLKSGAPEEALHYIFFGLLGVLLYRAYSHRVRDVSIYLLSLLAGSIVGVFDEVIQWALPSRYFDVRDVWLNVTGCLLVQIAIAFGIRPPIISGLPDAMGVRRLCLTGAVLASLLAICHINTPTAVLAYSQRIPMLGFLADQDDAMFEYGHLHVDPRLGSFKSRLSLSELQEANQTLAESSARIIDLHLTGTEIDDFIRAYPAIKYPFSHEAWVHFRSRDINLNLARGSKFREPARKRYTFAYREHQILKTYFGNLYNASIYSWSAEKEEEIKAEVIAGLTRQSKVSQHLITAYTLTQAMWFFCLLVLALLFAAHVAGQMHKKRDVVDV